MRLREVELQSSVKQPLWDVCRRGVLEWLDWDVLTHGSSTQGLRPKLIWCKLQRLVPNARRKQLRRRFRFS